MTKTWKSVERKVAAFFGTKRTPLSGGNSGHTRSDTLHSALFVETKYRVKHSAVQLWRKTEELARKENKIPVVALVEKGARGFWFVIHASDLVTVANQRIVWRQEALEIGAELCDGYKGECSGDCDNCDHEHV